MTKKVLAIDLDEVIRSKWLQFDRFYAQEFTEEGIKTPFDTYDLRNHYQFNESIETVNYLNDDLPDDISPTEYIIDKETGVAPVDHLAFRKKDEKMTADEAFNKFLYQDFLVEIFSSAPVLYRGLDLDLRKFKLAFEKDIDILLFSCEKNESISPTLFFISKLRPIIRKFYFPETPEEIWKIADIVITTDPKIIKSKPYYDLNRKVVVLNRPHNETLEGDLKTMNFIDLVENETFKEMIK
jgi:hypothetical protein